MYEKFIAECIERDLKQKSLTLIDHNIDILNNFIEKNIEIFINETGKEANNRDLIANILIKNLFVGISEKIKETIISSYFDGFKKHFNRINLDIDEIWLFNEINKNISDDFIVMTLLEESMDYFIHVFSEKNKNLSFHENYCDILFAYYKYMKEKFSVINQSMNQVIDMHEQQEINNNHVSCSHDSHKQKPVTLNNEQKKLVETHIKKDLQEILTIIINDKEENIKNIFYSKINYYIKNASLENNGDNKLISKKQYQEISLRILNPSEQVFLRLLSTFKKEIINDFLKMFSKYFTDINIEIERHSLIQEIKKSMNDDLIIMTLLKHFIPLFINEFLKFHGNISKLDLSLIYEEFIRINIKIYINKVLFESIHKNKKNIQDYFHLRISNFMNTYQNNIDEKKLINEVFEPSILMMSDKFKEKIINDFLKIFKDYFDSININVDNHFILREINKNISDDLIIFGLLDKSTEWFIKISSRNYTLRCFKDNYRDLSFAFYRYQKMGFSIIHSNFIGYDSGRPEQPKRSDFASDARGEDQYEQACKQYDEYIEPEDYPRSFNVRIADGQWVRGQVPEIRFTIPSDCQFKPTSDIPKASSSSSSSSTPSESSCEEDLLSIGHLQDALNSPAPGSSTDEAEISNSNSPSPVSSPSQTRHFGSRLSASMYTLPTISQEELPDLSSSMSAFLTLKTCTQASS